MGEKVASAFSGRLNGDIHADKDFEYTVFELHQMIRDPDFIIFYNGQLYVDLGAALTLNNSAYSSPRKSVVESYKNFFKVTEFLEQMEE